VTGLYSEPPPTTRRVTLRDDTLPHQIRIIMAGGIYVSCVCRTRRGMLPLGPSSSLAESWAVYDRHVAGETP
jgi:hypothetical protein